MKALNSVSRNQSSKLTLLSCEGHLNGKVSEACNMQYHAAALPPVISFFKNTYLFIIFSHAGSSLPHASFLQLWLLSMLCTDFSLWWLLVVEHRHFSSCGARAQLPCSMWDLLRPGIKPMTPAQAGGFLTTALPGTPEKNAVSKQVVELVRILYP